LSEDAALLFPVFFLSIEPLKLQTITFVPKLNLGVPLQMARMTDTDISGLKMKLIHKKKLTKVVHNFGKILYSIGRAQSIPS
jgi:hypothetical protein